MNIFAPIVQYILYLVYEQKFFRNGINANLKILARIKFKIKWPKKTIFDFFFCEIISHIMFTVNVLLLAVEIATINISNSIKQMNLKQVYNFTCYYNLVCVLILRYYCSIQNLFILFWIYFKKYRSHIIRTNEISNWNSSVFFPNQISGINIKYKFLKCFLVESISPNSMI